MNLFETVQQQVKLVDRGIGAGHRAVRLLLRRRVDVRGVVEQLLLVIGCFGYLVDLSRIS